MAILTEVNPIDLTVSDKVGPGLKYFIGHPSLPDFGLSYRKPGGMKFTRSQITYSSLPENFSRGTRGGKLDCREKDAITLGTTSTKV
jgi:hypothetical protein